jgi:hypothetical protein
MPVPHSCHAAHMTVRGAADVQAVDLGPLTHGTAQWPAFIAARIWFDSFPAQWSGRTHRAD